MASPPQTPQITPPTSPQTLEKPSAWRTLGLSAWMRDLVISIAISFFFIIFLYEPVKVEGTSLLPGVQDQGRIFINKFGYRWEPISRGDIVVFRYPRDTAKSFIKRVIAVGGDRVVIDKGRVYLNGQLLREPYVPREYADTRSTTEIIVPQGEFFVMGDHRSMSDDSRDFGPVDDGFITGKAVFVYWPVDKLGLLR